MQKNFYEQLIQIIDKESVLVSEPMSRHTTFRIGEQQIILLSLII